MSDDSLWTCHCNIFNITHNHLIGSCGPLYLAFSCSIKIIPFFFFAENTNLASWHRPHLLTTCATKMTGMFEMVKNNRRANSAAPSHCCCFCSFVGHEIPPIRLISVWKTKQVILSSLSLHYLRIVLSVNIAN